MRNLPALKKKESSIENKFRLDIKALGGKAYKFSSPGQRAVPDRLVVVKGMAPLFVEFKAPGKHLTPAQEREHIFLAQLKQATFVVDSKEAADSLISFIKKHMEV